MLGKSQPGARSEKRMGKRLSIIERAKWHKTERGCWSLSLGVRGLSVRVQQREPGAVFYRVVWLPGKGWTYKSLRTKDRDTARRVAEEFLVESAKTQDLAPVELEPLTLKRLWELYQQEAAPYRKNTKKTQNQKRSAARRLIIGLSESKRVDHLTVNDLERYSEMRRTGLGWPDGEPRRPVRAAAVRDDLALLRTMIIWATKERRPDGSWLLPENPIRGFKLPREENPRRPVATYDRFIKVRNAMQRLAAHARHERTRQRWLRMELALVLSEATGRRIGAIRGLRWSDISFDSPRIRWRAEYDKRGRESVVPIPVQLADELRRFQVRLKVVGDTWLFPRKRKDAPWPTDIFGELLDHAEREAKVPKLEGGRWHPYRRKWATERKEFPLVDVMAAGGWRDRNTLTTSYQHADEDTMLEVMAAPTKLVGRKARGR